MTRRCISRLTLAATLLLLTACGDGQPSTVPVRGSLFLKQKNGKQVPMAGARIVFHPSTNAGAFPVHPAAVVRDNGCFELGMYQKNDGAPEGDYVITVEWRKTTKVKYDFFIGKGNAPHGADLLRGAFADYRTSPLKRTVKRGKALDIVVEAP